MKILSSFDSFDEESFLSDLGRELRTKTDAYNCHFTSLERDSLGRLSTINFTDMVIFNSISLSGFLLLSDDKNQTVVYVQIAEIAFKTDGNLKGYRDFKKEIITYVSKLEMFYKIVTNVCKEYGINVMKVK